MRTRTKYDKIVFADVLGESINKELLKLSKFWIELLKGINEKAVAGCPERPFFYL